MPPRSGATAGSACLPSAVAATPWLSVLLYGLASRKSFTIGTMTAMRCISVTWVVLGKMAKREAERGRRSPWTSPPFSRNISATCSSRMPSASPKMKNMGNVVAFSLSAPRSCPFEAVASIRLTNFGKSSGVGLSFLYSTSMVEPFLGHAVAAERGRNDDHLPHLVRMADRARHRHAAAHAVADEVRFGDLEMIEQRRHIVGEVFLADVAFDVRRAPVALHFDGDHLPRLGEFGDPAGPVVGDGHERAVKQHHRIAASVDFVVHFQPVDRRVARRWLFLRRYDSRHEHHQE